MFKDEVPKKGTARYRKVTKKYLGNPKRATKKIDKRRKLTQRLI